MNPFIIGTVLDRVASLADDLFTSDEERAKFALESQRVEAELLKGQMDINKVEAASASTFVAGWRPAIGWVSVLALGYQYILYPLLVWVWSVAQASGYVPAGLEPPPLLDIEALVVLLCGMLGLAGLRTTEKVKGVSGKG
jgi:hypothetical protein